MLNHLPGRKVLFAGILLAIMSPAHAAKAEAGPGPIFGVWQNPHGSVRVETISCGDMLCGHVVWATPEAADDARDGGTEHLVGTKLLQDYRRTSAKQWTGRVFVPDMGDTFYSKIRQINASTIRVSGCLLGGLICKSQLWHRI